MQDSPSVEFVVGIVRCAKVLLPPVPYSYPPGGVEALYDGGSALFGAISAAR